MFNSSFNNATGHVLANKPVQVLAAIVLNSGGAQEILLQNWPHDAPEPIFLAVDYDTQGYEGANRVGISVGARVDDVGCLRLPLRQARAGQQDALLPSRALEALQAAEGINRYTPAEHGELLLQAVQKLYTALQAGPRAVDQCGQHVQDVRLALRNLRASVGDVVALDLDALSD